MLALRQTVEVARQTLLLQARSRLKWLLGLAILGAGAIALLVAVQGGRHERGDQLHGIFTYVLFFGFALPLLLMYMGVAAVHGDIEDRTATYLFVRPVPRWSLLAGKWAAVALLGSLIATLAMTVVYGVFASRPDYKMGIGPSGGMWLAFVQAGLLCAPAYAAVGVAAAAISKRPLITGFAYLILSEGILSNLPPQAGVRSITVADPIRRWLFGELHPDGDLREVLLGTLAEFKVAPEQMGEPLPSLLKFTLITLGLALLVYSRREYDSRPRE